MKIWFSTLLLLAAACGCVSRSVHTSNTPAIQARNEGSSASAAPVSPAAAVRTAAPEAPAGSTAAVPGGEEANQDLLKMGYKPVKVRGEVRYCRKEMLTGSRFTTEVCLTEDQINSMHKAREMQFAPPPCGGDQCIK